MNFCFCQNFDVSGHCFHSSDRLVTFFLQSRFLFLENVVLLLVFFVFEILALFEGLDEDLVVSFCFFDIETKSVVFDLFLLKRFIMSYEKYKNNKNSRWFFVTKLFTILYKSGQNSKFESKNRNFSLKSTFWSKIEILVKTQILVKIEIWVKTQILVKIEISVKNRNLVNHRNFGKNRS